MDVVRRWPREERPTGLVTPVRVDPAGLVGPTRGQARGPAWRRPAPGLYVPADTPADCVFQHVLQQGARVGAHGAVTGWASLRFRGARYFDGTVDGDLAPVPLVVGDACLRTGPASVISREQLASGERELVGGIWCTTPERALFDEIRRHRMLWRAVADVEVAVAAGLVSFAGFATYVRGRNPWTGIGFARDVVALAGFGCWSRPEVRMALTWTLDTGFGRPLCNVPVFDRRERLVAIVDLLDPVAGCVGEYQGGHHEEHEQHRDDVAREQALREVGLEVFEVVAGDHGTPGLVESRMRSARSRSLFLPEDVRPWTLDQPAWWPAWAAARGLL